MAQLITQIDLTDQLDAIHHPKLLEYQEQLICYLAHQTRKVYLNAQFNSILCELDDNGAIIVVDYKMRILPATAREIKSEFFEKRGWTLHTTLIFRKNKENYEELDVQAYDHWSSDTKQDAWFTASCFESVFTTMDPKPLWVKIISDNGGHYHNSELMSIISHWYDWYNIEVRGWIFLSQIAHAIKRYIRIGCDLTEGKNIETALQDLSGTLVSHIELNRNIEALADQENSGNNQKSKNANEKKSKTIPGISKWFEWNWPIMGQFAGYIRARSLPHIGKWIDFSPAQICDTIHRPSPTTSDSTKLKTLGLDQEFPLSKGWALKENLKLGNKGGGKRISKKVVQYLQGFFLAGNLRAADRYSPKSMHACLKELATEGELTLEEIPTVKTIKGWIGRYSANFKKEASEKALENNQRTAVEGSTSQKRPNK
ncbi:hypothetical protein RhiirA4_486653, partial [Rhizophagus irregularis]